MSADWYCQLLGQEFGPMPWESLQKMALDGEISPDDLVRNGPAGPWQPASGLGGLTFAEAADPGMESDEFVDINEIQLVTGSLPHSAGSATKPAPRASAAPGYAAPSASEDESDDNYLTAVRWYVRTNGSEFGPTDYNTLRQMVRREELFPDAEVRFGRKGSWGPARDVPGLFRSGSTNSSSSVEMFVVPDSTPEVSTVSPGAVRATAVPSSAPAAVQAGNLLNQQLQQLAAASDPASSQFQMMNASTALEQWYCQVAGQELGPMAITSLVHMVLQGRIFPDDQLRFGSAGEWFPAGQVPNLFPKGAATAYAPGTARSARPKLPPAEGVMERLERIYAAEAAHAQTSAVPPARETAVSGASTAVTAGAPRAPAAPSPPAPVAASAMPGSSTGELESSRSAATDIIRGFSASVAKGSSSAPSRAPASRAPARAPARSFSGGGGEGIFGLPPAVLGGAVAAALLGLAAWYLVPLLLSGQAAKAKYRALLELKKEVEVARQSRDSNKGTDIAKKIEKIRVESHVKSDKSPLYHVRNAASYLERAARAVNAPVEDADPYDMAMKQFEIAMSKAGASLGIK